MQQETSFLCVRRHQAPPDMNCCCELINWSELLNHINIMVIVVKNFIAGDFVESKNISQDNTINRLVDNITVFV